MRPTGESDMRVCRGIVLLLFGISLNAQIDRVADDRTNFYSLQKEAALGSQMASELRRRTTSIEDSGIREYVDRLGQRLAMEMPDAKFSFQFTVIADDPCPTTHEPASLPGGYVFVPAPLLVAAHSEAEFAGMMAHAMEHIAVRQATRLATLGRVASTGNIPLIFIGSWAGACSEHGAVPAGFLATQRTNELEADGLAVQAMARAGFDPKALVDYIERVQPPQTERSSALPSRDERVAAMDLIIGRQPALDYEEATGEFVAVQEKTAPYIKHR
ncbi:MAG TPA: M48 family metalloprotease [Bryobacteraceae bacterium]|nr:M48 family metalloprotease [Bryobacteraceae bacterium]